MFHITELFIVSSLQVDPLMGDGGLISTANVSTNGCSRLDRELQHERVIIVKDILTYRKSARTSFISLVLLKMHVTLCQRSIKIINNMEIHD